MRGTKKSDNIFILMFLVILLIILAFALTLRPEYPKMYLDETISIVGKFVEFLSSFFKGT